MKVGDRFGTFLLGLMVGTATGLACAWLTFWFIATVPATKAMAI